MTGRMLLLNALSEYVCGMYGFLGDNLAAPMAVGPVFTTYNTTAEEEALDRRLFEMFRDEIESSQAG